MMSQKNYIIICHISPRYLQIFQQIFYRPHFLTFHDMPQQYLQTNLPYIYAQYLHIYLFVQPIVFLKNNRFYFQQTTWTNPHLMKRKEILGFEEPFKNKRFFGGDLSCFRGTSTYQHIDVK